MNDKNQIKLAADPELSKFLQILDMKERAIAYLKTVDTSKWHRSSNYTVDQLNVIKNIRLMTDLGLKEALDLCRSFALGEQELSSSTS